VAKLSLSTEAEHNTLTAYKAQMEVQSVAACLANIFNKETDDTAVKVKYTIASTFRGKEDKAGPTAPFQVGGLPHRMLIRHL
jgi:pyruvate/2-oxoglutarate dehydrogenase complex dihydrolipoamide acyltransferase (E2) component